jgi:protein-S-isoprenylcysteine O-methyltransferase Ste14
MTYLQLRIPPVALVLIFALAMAAIANVVPAAVHVPARLEVAFGIALVGALVALTGVIAFRRHKTTVNPLKPEQSSSLVATGIYRVTRNPMYLGFLLTLIGWSVFLSNWVSALLLPAFIAYMNWFQIKPEEQALSKIFGLQFDAYCKTVRRWL